jgi:heme exporter protein D
MNWNSPAEFFAMGGNAFYVWGSFAMAVLALSAEVALLRQRRRNALAALHRKT